MSYGYVPPPGPPPGYQPSFPGQGGPQYSPMQMGNAPMGAPPMGIPSTVQDTTGTFEGVSFRIDHRDSNSILQATLQPGYTIKAKPGAMVAMDARVQIQGAMKFSWGKMISGGEMSESLFTGPGDVILAPEIWGDIVPINIQPNVTWSVGKDAYLACTTGITRTSKSQGFMKGFLSGEGFFVANIQGQGVLWVQSIGAIIKRDLQPGEQWIVDNGHLVAWSAAYNMERISTSGGGLFSASHTGEGMVCRFQGPGTVYIQTRNPQSLGQWIAAQVPQQSRGGGGGAANLIQAFS